MINIIRLKESGIRESILLSMPVRLTQVERPALAFGSIITMGWSPGLNK